MGDKILKILGIVGPNRVFTISQNSDKIKKCEDD